MEKILFIDDAQIATSRGVERRIHPARKYEGNPVLISDRAWEGQETKLGTVCKEADRYRMWYQSSGTTPAPDGIDTYHRSLHLYAESADGLAWSKPELGLSEDFRGSYANNIILARSTFRRDINPSVLHTPGAPDGHAYRMFTYGAGYELCYDGHYVTYSDDGLRWGDGPQTPVIPGFGDLGWFMHDEVDGIYRALLTYRRWESEVFSTQSADGLEWALPRLAVTADAEDSKRAGDDGAERVFFPAMPIARYGPVLLGFLQVLRGHRAGGVTDGTMDVQLVCSRDGKTWRRVGDRSPILERGAATAPGGHDDPVWDDGLVWMGNSLVDDGDEVVAYYTGCRRREGCLQWSKWPKSIGRASWSRDRLVGLAARGEAVVETTTTIATGNLHINADASRGRVSAALLDENGSVIEGFSAADCEPLADKDALDYVLEWRGSELASLAAGNARIHLTLRDAELFSLWWEQ